MQTKDGFILKGLNYRFVGDTACAFVSIKELIGFHFGRSQLGWAKARELNIMGTNQPSIDQKAKALNPPHYTSISR